MRGGGEELWRETVEDKRHPRGNLRQPVDPTRGCGSTQPLAEIGREVVAVPTHRERYSTSEPGMDKFTFHANIYMSTCNIYPILSPQHVHVLQFRSAGKTHSKTPHTLQFVL